MWTENPFGHTNATFPPPGCLSLFPKLPRSVGEHVHCMWFGKCILPHVGTHPPDLDLDLRFERP